MENKLIGAVVAIATAVILIGSVLVTTLDRYDDETRTYTNDGMPYAAADSDDHTIVITADTITVDEEELDLTLFPEGFTQYTLVFTSDGDFIRIDYDADATRIVSSSLTTFLLNSGETVTIAISGTDATITSSDTTVSSASMDNVAYYISSEGDYVMSLNPCVTSESAIIGAGQTNFGTSAGLPAYTFTYASWSGTVESVTAAIVYLASSATYSAYSIASTEVNTTAVEGNLVRIDSVLLNYSLTSSDVDYSVTATYTYFLAPATVAYDNPEYVGSTYAGLIAVIPIMVIVGLVAATAVFITRRD